MTGDVSAELDLTRLITLIGSDPDLRFPPDGVARSIRTLIDLDAVNPNGLPPGIRSHSHGTWTRTRNRQPSIERLLKLSRMVNVNIVDLLAGEVVFNYQFPWLRLQESDEGRHRLSRSDQHAKILLSRAIALSEKVPIPSFRSIAAGIGTSTGFLSNRYPEFSKRVKEQRTIWRREQQKTVRRKARAAAVEYIQSQLVTSPYSSPSRKAALRALRVSTQLPKHVLRREINAMWNQLLNHKSEPNRIRLDDQHEEQPCISE
jgi:hypothetical protein